MIAMIGMGANAAITYGSNNAGAFYAGAKVGQVNADITGASKALNYGVYGGYNLDSNFGAEVELLTSQDKKYTLNEQGREYNVGSFGAYGTYRYHFGNVPVYAKGKLGFAKTNLDDQSTDGAYINKSDKMTLAGGVAVGYNLGESLGVEAGYSYLSTDVSNLAVGAHFIF